MAPLSLLGAAPRGLVALLVLTVSTTAVPAAAQRRTPAPAPARGTSHQETEAAQRKREGDDAFRALKYADALRAYEASFRLVANPALHFNRGRSLEALERFAEAIEAFESFQREAPAELRSKAGNLGAHVNELRAKVATVRFAVKPEGARVLLRNVAIGTAPIGAPVHVNAGSAHVEIEAEGFVRYERDHDLPGNTETAITVTLVAKTAATAAATSDGSNVSPSPTMQSGEPKAESRGVLTKWWFWTAAGVVVAGAATAVLIVSTRPDEPRSGDLGQLGAPLLRF